MSRRQGLYADPMIYDILHGPNTAREVSAFEKLELALASRALSPSRLWFEPACGTGRYLRVAEKRGRRVAGFDLDEGQIEYARRRANCHPGGKTPDPYFVADMRGFAAEATHAGFAPHCADFAFNPVNSIRHLGSDREMLQHFEQMAAILKPGALYVVGLSLTDYDWLEDEEDLWEAARGQCRVSQLVNFLMPEPGTKRSRIETVISHLTVTRPSREEHFDDSYDLRTYDQAQWIKLIKRSSLTYAGSFDAWGQPLVDRVVPYQLEALRFTPA